MKPALLILEDDELLMAQLVEHLAEHYECATAASMHEAREKLERLPALHAALLDQNLGRETGLDLIAPLLTRFPDCRVVMLTGYGSIPAAVAATRRGALNYLTKPAAASEILAALGDVGPVAEAPALADAPPSLERLEWEHIQRILESHDGNVSAAARTLGMHRRTLQRRLKKRPPARAFERDRPSRDDH